MESGIKHHNNPPPDAVMKGYLYHTSSLVSLHTKTGACDIHSYLP